MNWEKYKNKDRYRFVVYGPSGECMEVIYKMRLLEGLKDYYKNHYDFFKVSFEALANEFDCSVDELDIRTKRKPGRKPKRK